MQVDILFSFCVVNSNNKKFSAVHRNMYIVIRERSLFIAGWSVLAWTQNMPPSNIVNQVFALSSNMCSEVFAKSYPFSGTILYVCESKFS